MSSSNNWPPELDAVIAAPQHHRVVLENERVRVLDTRIPVGDTVPVHTHRWPGVYHTIVFSHFIRRDAEGNVLFDSRKVAGKGEGGRFAGGDSSDAPMPAAAFLENLPPHSVENVGDREIHLVSVEMKSAIE